EDVVEINCHSGYRVLERLLSLALERGARLAQPGEFTLRAFLSGRVDLTQSEAVLEVIRARSEAALQVAASHLQGGLGRGLARLREDLLDLLARVEAALDFPEEAEELAPAFLEEALAPRMETLARLTASYRQGRLLREGLLAVIAGRTIAGTTRDLIEETITLGSIPVRLSDTAGLGPARDRLEELGMKRTRERLAQADLVLYLLDGSLPMAAADPQALREMRGRRGLAVINKADLPRTLGETEVQAATSFT